MNSLGERIQEIRKKNKLSQKEMADKMQITQGGLSGIENNKKSPTADTLISLCQELNIDANWLLTGEESIKASQDEESLIIKYRKLTERQKGKVELFIDQLAEEEKNKESSSTFPNTG